MSMPKLRSCPFCGGKAELQQMPNAPLWYRVQCRSHQCGGTTWACMGEAKAVATWNRRPDGEQA
jgi:hypothetical protein